MYDIIPDIHGQAGKLTGALTRLGYRNRNGGWRHDDPNRTCVFLGDFIDRGPDSAGVVDIVRRMLDAGTARAIMGNHELNAIHFHTAHPGTSAPLRPHTDRKLRQHARFLAEFPLGAPATREVIGWMRSLPLFLEIDGFRAVHACWDEDAIAALKAVSPSGVLNAGELIRAADRNDPLHGIVEITTKGPEAELPDGHVFTDKDGTRRGEIRLQWWNAGAASWRDIAMSVPDLNQLPRSALPANILKSVYPASARPVFFGHYWLSGAPRLQAANALCLDYSAGGDGPLVSYRMTPGDGALTLAGLAVHDHET